MSAKRSIKRFLMFRAQYPDSYAIWHSRIATHGVKNESNCHPFQVGGDRLTYLAHNGMLDVDQPKDDKRSDTRVFAEEVLPAMGGVCSLDNPTIFDMVSGWARNSKLAILTLDPKAERQLYIINEKAGSWDDNFVWWSNTRHRPVKKYEWAGSPHSTGQRKQENLTEIISVVNEETGLWEEPVSKIAAYREWKYGDVWDSATYTFSTPPPGTPLVKARADLSIVKHVGETTLDNLESEEDDSNAPTEIVCPQCNERTDLEEDSGYCTVCRLCFDCGAGYISCMCYTPRSSYSDEWGN